MPKSISKYKFSCLVIVCIITNTTRALQYSQLLSTNGSAVKPGPSYVAYYSPSDESKAESDSAVEVSGEYPASEFKDQSEMKARYQTGKPGLFRIPFKQNSATNHKYKKVHPGQFADKKRNWQQWPPYWKGPVSQSDSNIAWAYWEDEENEEWEPDDADDSVHSTSPKPTTTTTSTTTTTTTTTTTPKPDTTTTTSTTPAPTTMTTKLKEKPSVSIHKHFHYIKKNGPWKDMAQESSTTTDSSPTMEDMMMKMPDEMMMDMMMKGMMMMPPSMLPPVPDKDNKEKGKLSGIFEKLSNVDPITILVAGIVPASLILAAALPSVMNKMNMNKWDGANMNFPMISTTAVSSGDDGQARFHNQPPTHSITAFLEDIGEFGIKALENPKCARKMFCKLAADSIRSESPLLQKAVQFAAVAMENTWLEQLGVRSIIESLNDGTCNQVDCDQEQAR